MYRTDFQKVMADAFGTELTGEQLWALTKFAKNVRLRCRNNAAFNNFMNATFPHARFQQVTKQRPSRYNPSIMESYPGLQISIKGEIASTGKDTEGEE